MKTLLVTAILATGACAGACIPVAGDRIFGRDLALANPAFSALAANMTVAYAPAPGTKRIFAQAELARIARANNIALPAPEEVCFEIPMRAIDNADVIASMRRALPPDTELRVVDPPSGPVPVGSIEFPLTGLEPPARGTRMWRGYVKYGETLRMRISARVDARYRVEAVVAVRDLSPNVPILASHLRIDTVNAPLEMDRHVARRIDEVLGRIPRKSITAGSTIPIAILDLPPAVRRGDSVKVEVRSGPARVQIDAVAETAGRAGDMLELRNPSSGKTFRARLEGASKAVIVVGAGQTL